MDGFTTIPIQNTTASVDSASTQNIPTDFSNTPYRDNAIVAGGGIEIIDDAAKNKSKSDSSLLLPLSIIILFVSFGYFGYLFFQRQVTIEKLSVLSEQFQVLSANVDKEEIDGFIALDNSLKAVRQKISTHTQLAGILTFVNKNIRTNVQISDYSINSRENEISVILVSVAPSFRELAEQTEKMAELKTTGAIKDFTVNQMSLESDGRKIRYSLNLSFDKSKNSVTSLSKQDSIQNTNTINNN